MHIPRTEQELQDITEKIAQRSGLVHDLHESVQLYEDIQTLAENKYVKAIPVIESYVLDEDPDLRKVALKALTWYFKIPYHWKSALLALLADEWDDNRMYAAIDLGMLKRNTQDEDTLQLLAIIVFQKVEDFDVRRQAYEAMLIIQGNDTSSFGRIVGQSQSEWESYVDWEWVKQCLFKAKHVDSQ